MIARWLARFAPLSLCVFVGALALAAVPASAAQTRRLLGTFGGASSTVADPYPLSDPQEVAVDQGTEDVYVADMGNHRVEKFSATGQFLLAFGGNVGGSGVDVCGGAVVCASGSEGSAPGELASPEFIAVDNDPLSPSFHDVYVADTADNVISKFTAEGALVESWGVKGQLNGSGTPSGSLGPIAGIAVGTTGVLYVFNLTNTVFKFEPDSGFSSELLLAYGIRPVGFAVNSAGDMFKVRGSGAILESGPSGEVLGFITAEAVGETSALTVAPSGDLYFLTNQGQLDHDVFNGSGEVEEPGGKTCALAPAEGCSASDSTDIGFAGSGIAALTSGDTFVADPGEGTIYRYGQLVTAVPPEAPRSEQTAELKAVSVKLQGVLNAASEGESGIYDFLYRQSASECEGGQATPVGHSLGGRGEVVSTTIGELVPHAKYTFCLRVSNGAGEVATGPPVSFMTLVAAPVPSEMSVSNVAATSATLEASVNPGGEVSSYVFELALAGGTFVPLNEARGVVAEGVRSVPVASFHTQSLQPATVYEFRVSATNSAGTVVGEPVSFTTQATGGGLELPDGRQWELVSPPDKHGAAIFPIGESSHVQAAADGDAVTFEVSVPTESNPAGFPGLDQVLSVREPDGWVSRDIMPPTEKITPLTIGEPEGYVAFSEDLSVAVLQQAGPLDPLISPEASEQTAYLRTNFVNGNVHEPCTEECFRPLVTGKAGYANVPKGTVIDRSEGCSSLCGPMFSGAALDLSHIAFKNQTPLLPGAGEEEEYEWADGRLSLGNKLPERRVSTSADGSWSYFVSGEALTSGAQSEPQCNVYGSLEGLCNLYVSHSGVTRLVAVLSNEDSPDWQGTASGSSAGDKLPNRTSRVSPDGRWFAFMSQRELTGYDSHDAASGTPDEEVYLYHAPENLASEAGLLVCASCDPTGARPVGLRYGSPTQPGTLLSLERRLVSGGDVWGENQWLAANIPGWTGYALESAIYQSRYLSDNGRLFFNSYGALVPQDVNGDEDVYEYEPPGVGDCATGSVLYSARSGGCVGLVSSGQAAGESAFLDASENGGDVFFLTAGKLVSSDYDTSLDVYDAHECTKAAPCFPAAAATPPACDTGDACKPAPSPQPAIYGSPPSATFSGAGNVIPGPPAGSVTAKAKGSTKAQKLARALRSCRARRGKPRRVCERQARARFARRVGGAKRGGR